LPSPPEELKPRLLAWYDRHRRTLPWRALGRDADAYAVLVSEVMLQQTTVATVTPRFTRFMQRFPTIEALAAAPLDAVLHEWQGLGYYRRARALHACARAVVARFGGRLPAEVEALESLPGIGAYTARAVAAIAHGRPVVPLDGNVARVLTRLAAIDTPIAQAGRRLEALAAGLAHETRPGDMAQALIELGALVCTPQSPACPVCPWSYACRAHARGLAAELPLKPAKRTRPERHAVAFLLRRADGAILFRRRPETGLLAGMIELPSTPWDAPAPLGGEAALAEAPAAAAGWRWLEGEVRHIFTHLALNLRIAEGRAERADEGFWWKVGRLDELALPTLTRKLLAHAGIDRGDGR